MLKRQAGARTQDITSSQVSGGECLSFVVSTAVRVGDDGRETRGRVDGFSAVSGPVLGARGDRPIPWSGTHISRIFAY